MDLSFRAVGDVNGDGYADLIVGIFGANDTSPVLSNSGATYVIFGHPTGYYAPVNNLTAIPASNGFRLEGVATGDQSGYSVANAGDMNGDGYDDIIIGANHVGALAYNGASYVVFGAAGGLGVSIDLSALNGTNGFKLSSPAGNYTGGSVATAGDVNGDGFADVIVGATGDIFNGGNSGTAYIVYGHSGSFSSSIALTGLDGTSGFRLRGALTGDQTGNSVSSAGDFNGDGYGDFIVGASLADPWGDASGAAYVVFGDAGGFGSFFDLRNLNGTNGFRIVGTTVGERTGISVASAGDINGDGYDDLIVGSKFFTDDGFYSGAAFIIYGGPASLGSSFNPIGLDGQFGFRLDGTSGASYTGSSVSSAGDVNGDGFDDLIVSAPRFDTAATGPGASYIVYGGDFRAEADVIGTSGADVINGTIAADILVGAQGDDVIFGRGGADAINGGSGNDAIHVADRLFFRVDGGTGTDTLHLDYSGTIDLSDIDNNGLTSDHGRLSSIEIIDIDNGFANTLILSKLDVIDIDPSCIDVGSVASLDNVLKIDVDNLDSVQLSTADSWLQMGSVTLTGYNVYQSGGVTIAVDTDITVTMV